MIRRRLVPGLIIAAVALSCSHSSPDDSGTNPGPPMPVLDGPARSNRAGVVVIHTESSPAVADPDVVKVCARNGVTQNGHRIPSTIVWVANDPAAKLGITFTDTSCVRAIHCEDNTCYGITNIGFGAGSNNRTLTHTCKYTILLNGAVAADPGAEVQNCCP